MAAICSFLTSNLLSQPKTIQSQQQQLVSKPSSFIQFRKQTNLITHSNGLSTLLLNTRNTRKTSSSKLCAVAEETSVSTKDSSSSSSEAAAKRVYVGNIPRTVDNSQLSKIFEEHGAVDKAEVMYDKYSKRSRRFAFVTMKTVEDANAAVEKLNGTEIGGRTIKVNITEKPLTAIDTSLLQAEESKFVDSPYKVYVGNLAKTVTSGMLKKLFSEKGKVLGAKISRVPGTSKSSGFGFVSFSSEEEVEAAISSLNDIYLEGQKVRVNKA